MFLPTFLALSSSVLLASNAAVLSSGTDDVDHATATFRGLSFTAKATPNADKGSSDNHTLLNEGNMEVRHSSLPSTCTTSLSAHKVHRKDFTLVIDTGSSDLWVIDSQKLKVDSTTNTTVNLTYGIGFAYGNIVYGPVSFGGYDVDHQAFLSVSKPSDQGSEGIIGLGLDGLSALERTTKNASTQSVMANMFAQHPSTPHLIGLALERSDDGEKTAGGFLTIGEYDPQFRNVTYTPKIPVTPTSASRWTVAMDAMTINGKHFTLKSAVQGTKKGQAIALIDSGTSLAYIPPDAVNAIYSAFNGAVHVNTVNQDAWFVPCLGQVNLSFTFANSAYPINPMELSSPVRVIDQSNQYTVCINTFRTPFDNTQRDLDFLLGDIFMRNVYSVFNFGNGSTTTTHGNEDNNAKGASIQLLSRTNRDQVFANFETQRKRSLEAYPPLFDLDKASYGRVDRGRGTVGTAVG
ncbi:aspartic peptidase domain-containing protein [Butyriboletus roseoflavus]|nr:aspartic peptidase domain-containing protein [Butyriboletus roseoflavus]